MRPCNEIFSNVRSYQIANILNGVFAHRAAVVLLDCNFLDPILLPVKVGTDQRTPGCARY